MPVLPPLSAGAFSSPACIVQGVGFRPFVHNLAGELKLGGYVLNSSPAWCRSGRRPGRRRMFRPDRHRQPPRLPGFRIPNAPRWTLGEDFFAIRPSAAITGEFALISPTSHLRRVPHGRRRPLQPPLFLSLHQLHQLRPRYTIIRDIPYDRPKTTMAPFTMCAACQAEFKDPATAASTPSQRLPHCGPSLWGGLLACLLRILRSLCLLRPLRSLRLPRLSLPKPAAAGRRRDPRHQRSRRLPPGVRCPQPGRRPPPAPAQTP